MSDVVDNHRRNFMVGLSVTTVLSQVRASAAETDNMIADAKITTDPDEMYELWPNGAPGGDHVTVQQTLIEREDARGLRDRIVTGVTRPTISVFKPKQANGCAVMLIPGGSYQRVVWDKEGFETARWLADQGITAFVLMYRLPGDGWAAGPDTPLQDAQRGLRMIRAGAAQWGLSPNKIGAYGFSAGGHVAASLYTRFDAQVYQSVDAADQVSARPDFGGLCYPVITLLGTAVHAGSRQQLLGAAPSEAQLRAYSPELHVSADTPPIFLVHAADDPAVPVDNSLMMFAALRSAKVAAEMHIFEEGGHGFGLRDTVGKPVAAWPQLFIDWLKRRGM